MPHILEIKAVGLADAATLLALSRKTFFDAFLPTNSPAAMEAYASKAFTLPQFEKELSTPDSQFYFALVNGAPGGYIKLNYNSAQTELQDAKAVEVERIYVLDEFQGKQIGQQLIAFAMETAVEKNLKYVWLGVWEHNTRAIKFYKSKGFEQFGSHQFMLGDDEQTDILMKKVL
ncbi:ribosomal protein S18 acetylase RimI-like enzyme [Mucilaginibacter sp. UYP25]|uniref:GNAT family N-acetyltransferase n=1 Tax=unclassified Mucilaginibacter TaxID=2617802 RepID=UPI0033996403